MKKYTKVLALALALTMLLSMSVFAEGTIDAVNKTADPAAADVTIENQANLKGEDKFALRYNGGTEKAGAMYLLLVLDDEGYEDEGVPTAGNIKYVNQATANAQGVATFDSVYPSDITNSTVYLAGGDLGGLTAVANITKETPAVTVLWGDADQSQSVNIMDALAILWHVDPSVVYELTTAGVQAADVDGMPGVSIMDALNVFWFIDPSTGVTKFPVE